LDTPDTVNCAQSVGHLFGSNGDPIACFKGFGPARHRIAFGLKLPDSAFQSFDQGTKLTELGVDLILFAFVFGLADKALAGQRLVALIQGATGRFLPLIHCGLMFLGPSVQKGYVGLYL